MAYRVINAIKNKDLLIKIKKKIMFCFIRNSNDRQHVMQSECYYKLKKEFKDIIDDFHVSDNEKKKSDIIWMCWLQGIESAPDLVKVCVNSVKRNFPDKQLIIIDENNLAEYIQFPQYISEKWKSGNISPAHYSDLIRIELLSKWGGTWIDATVLCTIESGGNYIFDEPLFVYKKMDLTRQDKLPIVASSWFMHATTNNSIILLVRELLHQYWKKHDFIVDYFLVHLFFTLATERYKDDWERVPMYNNHSPHTLQFELHKKYDENRWNQITKMSDFHKLNHHNDYTQTKDSFYQHIIEEYGDNTEYNTEEIL